LTNSRWLVAVQLAAAAEVKPVNAGAKMLPPGLDTVPGEHAHTLLPPGLAHTGKRLDLSSLPPLLHVHVL